jgi:hypothetical protein
MYSRKWPYVVVAIMVAFLVLSLQPVHSLKLEPPEEFFQVKVSKEIDQDAWGRAYWAVARNVRWKFQYREALPEEVPVEFRVADERSVPPSVAAHLRVLYWYQLRTVWPTPKVWNTSYKLEFAWISEMIDTFASWVVNLFKSVRGALP